jgi:hypothetical protein
VSGACHKNTNYHRSIIKAKVNLEKWYFSVLLNVINYNNILLRDDQNQSLGNVDETGARIRDITAGYTIESIKPGFFKSVRLSISARNLISFNSEVDYEKIYGRELYLKSVSLSAGFTF